MTLPYLLRLACVCAAVFAVVYGAVACLVSLAVPAALRAAEKMRAAQAARFALALRLLPAFSAALCVGALCAPSYMRFEQTVEPESVGWLCLGLAGLGALCCGRGAVRAARALLGSARYANHATLALAGVVRQRVIVSRAAAAALSKEQMDAALEHERAHAAAHDNLKRLAVLLAPAVLPGLGALERAWARYAEWAADDCAAAGDPGRPVALASALVRVARLGGGAGPELTTSFLKNAEGLNARVERLLEGRRETGRRWDLAAVGTMGAGAMVMLHAGTQPVMYGILERLMH